MNDTDRACEDGCAIAVQGQAVCELPSGVAIGGADCGSAEDQVAPPTAGCILHAQNNMHEYMNSGRYLIGTAVQVEMHMYQ